MLASFQADVGGTVYKAKLLVSVEDADMVVMKLEGFNPSGTTPLEFVTKIPPPGGFLLRCGPTGG